MKFVSAILLSCAALAFAADPQTTAAKNPPSSGPDASVAGGGNGRVYKKLGSVTWDPDAHKLAWTVESGSMVDGEFVPASKTRYEISPDEATMGASGETRGLDNEEAEELHHLLDILSLYCAQSVAWWDHGAPPAAQPTDPDAPKTDKPVKVKGPAAPAAPSPVRIAPGQAIARLQPIH